MAGHRSRLAGPSRPLGSPDIPQFFVRAAEPGVYAPHLYGSARIRFSDKRRKIDESRQVAFVVPLEPGTKTVDWDAAVPLEAVPGTTEPAGATYLPLPAGAMNPVVFSRWAKRFDRWLARTQRLEMTPKTTDAEAVVLAPKRGGVAVDVVGIVWLLTRPD